MFAAHGTAFFLGYVVAVFGRAFSGQILAGRAGFGVAFDVAVFFQFAGIAVVIVFTGGLLVVVPFVCIAAGRNITAGLVVYFANFGRVSLGAVRIAVIISVFCIAGVGAGVAGGVAGKTAAGVFLSGVARFGGAEAAGILSFGAGFFGVFGITAAGFTAVPSGEGGLAEVVA